MPKNSDELAPNADDGSVLPDETAGDTALAAAPVSPTEDAPAVSYPNPVTFDGAVAPEGVEQILSVHAEEDAKRQGLAASIVPGLSVPDTLAAAREAYADAVAGDPDALGRLGDLLGLKSEASRKAAVGLPAAAGESA